MTSFWPSSWVRWRAIKPTFARKSTSNARELAEKMERSHIAIEKHLHTMEKVQKCGAWVPHALSDNNKNQRATISAGLLARHRSTHGHKERFLYRIVTGDEKWCTNMKQLKEWLSPGKQAIPRVKQDLHPRKKMLCIWWDWEGIIHYELLERNGSMVFFCCMTTPALISPIRPRKPFKLMVGKCCHTHRTLPIWHQRIFTFFDLFQMLGGSFFQ